MLTAGKSHPVTFKVNVLGTNAEPVVRVMLNTNPGLVFSAVQTGTGWLADLDIPAGIAPGTYSLSVEVAVNGRFFTPVTKSVDIAAAEQEPMPEPPSEVVQNEKTSDEIAFSTEIEPPRDAAQPQPEVPRFSFMQLIAQKTADAPITVAAPSPAKKVVLPVKTKPIKITLADIAATADQINQTASPIETGPVPVAEVKHQVPVKLTKCKIIYE